MSVVMAGSEAALVKFARLCRIVVAPPIARVDLVEPFLDLQADLYRPRLLGHKLVLCSSPEVVLFARFDRAQVAALLDAPLPVVQLDEAAHRRA